MYECENGKTNPYCLSQWELVLPSLGPVSKLLETPRVTPRARMWLCPGKWPPLGRCSCLVRSAAHLSILTVKLLH